MRIPGSIESDLEALATKVEQEGRFAWPTLQIPKAAILAHLARHWAPGTDPIRVPQNLHLADLYLSCGCTLQQEAALLAFDETILSQVDRFLQGVAVTPSFVDEVRQVLRVRLLCADKGENARIAEYTGSGALVSFVRIAAVRTALNLRANLSEQVTSHVDQAVLDGLPAGDTPDLVYLRAHYQEAFRSALGDAFSSLDKNLRMVLRMRFALGMKIEAIATTLNVSRATVVRWQAAAEKEMNKETLRLLKDRLRVSKEELASLIRLARSQLQLNLSDLLKKTAAP